MGSRIALGHVGYGSRGIGCVVLNRCITVHILVCVLLSLLLLLFHLDIIAIRYRSGRGGTTSCTSSRTRIDGGGGGGVVVVKAIISISKP